MDLEAKVGSRWESEGEKTEDSPGAHRHLEVREGRRNQQKKMRRHSLESGRETRVVWFWKLRGEHISLGGVVWW